MKKLRDVTTRLSLAELVEALSSKIVDGATSPEVEPEGEKKFVKLHKTEKRPAPFSNPDFSDTVKKDTSKAGKEPLPGFPPEVKEEEEIDEARFSKKVSKPRSFPYRISEPKKRSLEGVKTDPKGNVILSKKQQRDVEHLPRSRKLSGRPYKPVREQEELDEATGGSPTGRRSKTRIARQKAGPNFPEKKDTVLVTNKGDSAALRGGGVHRIPKNKYNPNVHSLAEKWGVDDAVNPREKGKYAGWSLSQLRAALNKPGADKKELNFAIRAKTGWGKVKEETEQLDESGPTKKHFQMAADAIKAIPDESKRKEHASSHADLYSKQNPRFDRGKFLKACNVKEETQLDEVITKSTPVGDVIHDFVHSDNPKFEGKSKKERIRMALGAAYAKRRGK
jgi:hypothetical protein